MGHSCFLKPNVDTCGSSTELTTNDSVTLLVSTAVVFNLSLLELLNLKVRRNIFLSFGLTYCMTAIVEVC